MRKRIPPPHTHRRSSIHAIKMALGVLIGWEAHGPRIITASFRTPKKKIKMKVIQWYAPTNDSEEENKPLFYSRLQHILDKCREQDVTILMGDFNAKIGSDNNGYEEVMGTQGDGEIKENGERLADTCALNNSTIGGSMFTHKRIHKTTWISPDHLTENQIDHICIGKRFRRSLEDVRVKRAEDVASDHHLIARLKLKPKRNWMETATNRRKHSVGLLKDPQTRAAYKLNLANKFQVLQEQYEKEKPDLDSLRQNMK